MSESHRIEVALLEPALDTQGRQLAADLRQYGLGAVKSVRSVRVYTFGGVSGALAERVAREFLADAVTDSVAIDSDAIPANGDVIVEISRKPGVMDPVEQSVRKGVAHLGGEVEWVRASAKYLVAGEVDPEAVGEAVGKLLANDLIEEITVGRNAPHHASAAGHYAFERVEVPIDTLADEQLAALSAEKQLYMTLPEMHCVRDYFRRIGRAPTDIELETLAQTWSEHCVHKTLKGKVRYRGPEGEEFIDNLLKNTVARVTRELDKPWCLSVFVDNAGVIEFDEDFGAAFKVETHNHPSALEPYGGAGTGIGGVIRDCLGTGLGARPVLNTDIFCFGPPDLPAGRVPKGALHPRRVMRGVVGGVRDYGNRMGIPTANGAVCFDERYIGNPLVFCGTAGLIPRSMVEKEARPGQAAIVVGGRTGRDGIHGATFSSVELHEESETVSSGAVQIGNPIEEKKVRDFQIRARDAGLYTCVTDCGAGGLSSAVGEMGAEIGVEVELADVPLKYAGLSYTEIWISEAQERLVFSADDEKIPALQALADEEDVEMTVIGRFTGDRMLRLRYGGELVGELEMEFLHDGVPQIERQAEWFPPEFPPPALPETEDFGETLRRVLGDWNVCSKEWIIRQYDHEVQGASVLKPLVGLANDGPGDAAVIAPVRGSKKGIIVSNGINPAYADLDPYWMAAAAIDEALRNVIAVGGDLSRCAILDNFCWGNCDKPDRLGGLVRAAKACYDFGKAYGVPFISGKDSLNNEFASPSGTVAIPGTLLVSAMAVIDDIDRIVSMDAKAAGNFVYLVGLTCDELGGSRYHALHGQTGGAVPRADAELGLRIFEALAQATRERLVRSLHDLSDGGLAAAAAEMAFAGGLGMSLHLVAAPTPRGERLSAPVLLFSESQGRFLAEIEPDRAASFEQLLKKAHIPFGRLGTVGEEPRFLIKDPDGNVVVDEPVADLKAAWQTPLAW